MAKREIKIMDKENIAKSKDLEELDRRREEIERKEKALDGVCINHFNTRTFPEHLMKRTFPLHWIGAKGKTRIVIEYDNDTGFGWIRISTENQQMLQPDKSIGSSIPGLNTSHSAHPVP